MGKAGGCVSGLSGYIRQIGGMECAEVAPDCGGLESVEEHVCRPDGECGAGDLVEAVVTGGGEQRGDHSGDEHFGAGVLQVCFDKPEELVHDNRLWFRRERLFPECTG